MIQIQFVKEEYERWIRALDRVLSVAIKEIEDDMQYRCAVEYAHLVVENIYNQIHMENYAPLSKRYKEWKEKHFPNRGFWRLKDDLVRNIGVFRYDKGFVGGIPAGVMDSGGKSWDLKGKPKEIAMYAKEGEYGIKGKRPARPIFTPSMEEYSEKKWIKQGDMALKIIGDAWR